MDEGLTRQEIIDRAGIPKGSFRRELKLAGIRKLPGPGRRRGNLTEYRYPIDTPARIIEARAARQIQKDATTSARKLEHLARVRGIRFDAVVDMIVLFRGRGASTKQSEVSAREIVMEKPLVRKGDRP